MKYYKLHFTLSTKLRGNTNYIKDYKLKIPPIAGQMYWEVPTFVGNIYNEKINFEPYLLDIELFANSKVNDLIMGGGPISTKLIVSAKLKSILEKYKKTGMQFFNINILKKKEFYDNYCLLNMYELHQEYIDFHNSVIKYEKQADDFKTTFNIKMIYLSVDSLKEFDKYLAVAKSKMEVIIVEKLFLKENLIREDFFLLKHVEGGVGYFVSDKLKKEIEDAGCTGIEFQPSELSYNEWITSGGEREKVYGRI